MELAFACIVAGVWAFLTITLGRIENGYSSHSEHSEDVDNVDSVEFDSLGIGTETSTNRIFAALWRRGLEEPTLKEMIVPWTVWNWG